MKYLKVGSSEWIEAARENQKQRDENRSQFFSEESQTPVGFDEIDLPYELRFNHFQDVCKKGSKNRISDESLDEVMSLSMSKIMRNGLASPVLFNTPYEGISKFSLKKYSMLTMASYFDDDNLSFAHFSLGKQ